MKKHKILSVILLAIYIICLITVFGCTNSEKTAEKPPADSKYTPYHDTVSKNNSNSSNTSSRFNSSGNTWNNNSSKNSSKTSTSQSTSSLYSHKCDFGPWETVEPATCAKYGLERRTCYSCGESEQRGIEKTTCEATSGTCPICGKIANVRNLLINTVKTYGNPLTVDSNYYVYKSTVNENGLTYKVLIDYDGDFDRIVFGMTKSGDISPYLTSITIEYKYGAATQSVDAVFSYKSTASDDIKDDTFKISEATFLTHKFNHDSPYLDTFEMILGGEDEKHRELMTKDTAKFLYEINKMCTKANSQLTIQQLGFTNF